MKRIILGVLVSFSLSGTCHALPIMNFAFDDDGTLLFGATLIPGTVTGTISGLQDNMAGQLAGIVVEITSFPAGLGGVNESGLNTSLWTHVVGTGFDVFGGVITGAVYGAQDEPNGFFEAGVSDQLRLNFDGFNVLTFDRFVTATGNTDGFAGTIYTATAVPEPATVTLLGAALIGFGLMSRRRRRQ